MFYYIACRFSMPFIRKCTRTVQKVPAFPRYYYFEYKKRELLSHGNMSQSKSAFGRISSRFLVFHQIIDHLDVDALFLKGKNKLNRYNINQRIIKSVNIFSVRWLLRFLSEIKIDIFVFDSENTIIAALR